MEQRSGLSDLLVAFTAISLIVTVHDMATRARKQAKAEARLASMEQGIKAIHAKLS